MKSISEFIRFTCSYVHDNILIHIPCYDKLITYCKNTNDNYSELNDSDHDSPIQSTHSPEPYSPELRPTKSPFVTDKLNLNNSESVTITDESNKSEKVPLDILFGKNNP